MRPGLISPAVPRPARARGDRELGAAGHGGRAASLVQPAHATHIIVAIRHLAHRVRSWGQSVATKICVEPGIQLFISRAWNPDIVKCRMSDHRHYISTPLQHLYVYIRPYIHHSCSPSSGCPALCFSVGDLRERDDLTQKLHNLL